MSELTSESLREVAERTFVEKTEFHPRLGSTSDRALELCRQPRLTTPLLVITPQQTSGRGRGSNRWLSQPGGLTFSLILEEHVAGIPLETWPRISLIVGLAVCEALESLVPAGTFGLKWPNDVHLNGRKVCGILVEVPPGQTRRLVIGIGLNVNNSFGDAPPEIREIGTSLCDVAGDVIAPSNVLTELLIGTEEELGRLAGGDDGFATRWQSRCVLTGRTVHLRAGEKTVSGVCAGIDEDGALVLQTEHGRQRMYGGTVVGIE